MYDVFARFFFFAWPLLVLGGAPTWYLLAKITSPSPWLTERHEPWWRPHINFPNMSTHTENHRPRVRGGISVALYWAPNIMALGQPRGRTRDFGEYNRYPLWASRMYQPNRINQGGRQGSIV